jgi:hypothetical protein
MRGLRWSRRATRDHWTSVTSSRRTSAGRASLMERLRARAAPPRWRHGRTAGAGTRSRRRPRDVPAHVPDRVPRAPQGLRARSSRATGDSRGSIPTRRDSDCDGRSDAQSGQPSGHASATSAAARPDRRRDRQAAGGGRVSRGSRARRRARVAGRCQRRPSRARTTAPSARTSEAPRMTTARSRCAIAASRSRRAIAISPSAAWARPAEC